MLHLYLLIIDLQVYLNQHIDNQYLGFLLACKRRDTPIIFLLQDKRTFRVIKSDSFELWHITPFPVGKATPLFYHLSALIEDSSKITLLSSWLFALIFFCSLLFPFSHPFSFPRPAGRKCRKPSFPNGFIA